MLPLATQHAYSHMDKSSDDEIPFHGVPMSPPLKAYFESHRDIVEEFESWLSKLGDGPSA